MQAIDHAAIYDVGIPRLLLMEHAGLAVARAVRSCWPRRGRGHCLVLCGAGHNGGDGLAAARHLIQWGHPACVFLAGAHSRLKAEPRVYAAILARLGVPCVSGRGRAQSPALRRAFAGAVVIVDALLGIGLQGTVRPEHRALIERVNASALPVVSVDVPSGLDANTGRPQGIAVRATVTVTLGLPKRGLLTREGRRWTGRLLVDDIGIPPQLLRRR